MNIKSLSTYNQEAKIIAERFGFSGAVVDFICSIISYGIYEDQMNLLTATNELNPDKATRINNVIDYAISRMYSVYRGSNPKLRLKIKATTTSSIARNAQLWSGKGFNVYSLMDLNMIKGQSYLLDCIISTSLNEVEAKEDMHSAFSLDFNLSDVSEDIQLFQAKTNYWEECNISKVMSDLTDKNIPLQVTSYNYGIRFYFKESRSERQSIAYKILYYPYYDEDILMEDLAKFNVNGFEVDDLTIINRQPREGLNDGIGDKSRGNLLSEGKIRSNTDILNIFNTYFSEKVLSSSMEITASSITIYYVPRNGLEISNINEFLIYMTPYLPCYTTLDPSGKVTYNPIKPLNPVKANKVSASIDVSIKSANNIDLTPVYEYLDSLTNKLGILLDTYEISTKIAQLIDVSYVKSYINGLSATSSNKLRNNQYLEWKSINLKRIE